MGPPIHTDHTLVKCSGQGLRFGYFNKPIEAQIDTRDAGPGELTVFCNGPERKAFCELRDHKDGKFTLTVRAQDIGVHKLHIQYDSRDVPGSPYSLRVSPASLVRLSGVGLHDGILSKYDGKFQVDSQEAGPGEIKIRVGGPQGAFRVRTQKEGRTLICKYDPKQAGTYIINILWSGDHVPGSPFKVFVCKNHHQLEQYKRTVPSNA